jgi:hypothetical protein
MAKREGYISWDEFFMGAAMLCAERSKDPNTQVGACIVTMKTESYLLVTMASLLDVTIMCFPGTEAVTTLMILNISMFAMQSLMQFSTAVAEALQEAEFMLLSSPATNVQKQ